VRIDNQTPFAVATVLWEHLDGTARLSIVVKATFSFEGRVAEPPPERRIPIFEGDQVRESEGSGAFLLESDRVPFKPRADVVLVGKAHASGGKPVTKMEIGLKVGRLARTLRVIGDRKWWFPTRMAMVPSPSEPEPFRTMDLVYERAFGGIDAVSGLWYAENPEGRGFIGKKSREAAHDTPLPNIEDPADPITSWDSRPKKPAGFGFYGRGWMPRRALAGTYDEKYTKERHPKPPLDFSLAFFNAAHPDLQVEGYLKGDEEVELRGATPEGIVRFKLPGVRPRITIARWAEDPGQWLDRQAPAAAAPEPEPAPGPEGEVDDEPVIESGPVAEARRQWVQRQAAAASQDEPEPEPAPEPEAEPEPEGGPTLDDAPVKEERLEAVLDTLVFLPEERLFYEVFRVVAPLASLESLEIARIRIEV
jgi:hypothetical protein